MKFFVACFIATLAVVQAMPEAEMMKQLKDNMDACAKELDVVIPMDGPGPDMEKMKDPKFKCMPKCMLEKFGAIDATGKLSEEKVRSIVPEMPAEAEEKIKSCIAKHEEADLCERYNNIQTCIIDAFKS